MESDHQYEKWIQSKTKQIVLLMVLCVKLPWSLVKRINDDDLILCLHSTMSKGVQNNVNCRLSSKQNIDTTTLKVQEIWQKRDRKYQEDREGLWNAINTVMTLWLLPVLRPSKLALLAISYRRGRGSWSPTFYHRVIGYLQILREGNDLFGWDLTVELRGLWWIVPDLWAHRMSSLNSIGSQSKTNNYISVRETDGRKELRVMVGRWEVGVKSGQYALCTHVIA